MAKSKSSAGNTAAFVGFALITYALVIIGLYFLAYAPKEAELAQALQDAATARAEAAEAGRRVLELEQSSSALRAQIADLENLLAELRETGAALESRITAREAELDLAQQMQSELMSALQQEIDSGQIRVERMLDSLRVDMVNEILFDSGEATLKQAGMDVLMRLGAVLEGATDKLIVVQGHTDSVPISGRLAQRFPTNWELSAARAVNVTRFLQEQVGLDPRRLSAAGFSEYRPRADNETPEGRQNNRRIEILLAPLPDTSFAQPIPGQNAGE